MEKQAEEDVHGGGGIATGTNESSGEFPEVHDFLSSI